MRSGVTTSTLLILLCIVGLVTYGYSRDVKEVVSVSDGLSELRNEKSFV